jgi:hypothetical protein
LGAINITLLVLGLCHLRQVTVDAGRLTIFELALDVRQVHLEVVVVDFDLLCDCLLAD